MRRGQAFLPQSANDWEDTFFLNELRRAGVCDEWEGKSFGWETHLVFPTFSTVVKLVSFATLYVYNKWMSIRWRTAYSGVESELRGMDCHPRNRQQQVRPVLPYLSWQLPPFVPHAADAWKPWTKTQGCSCHDGTLIILVHKCCTASSVWSENLTQRQETASKGLFCEIQGLIHWQENTVTH